MRRRMISILLAAALAVSGPAAVPAETTLNLKLQQDLQKDLQEDQGQAGSAVYRRVVRALLKTGPSAEGEAIIVSRAADGSSFSGNAVLLAEADRRNILEAAEAESCGMREYASLVRERLLSPENLVQDTFRIFLVRDEGRTTEELLELLYRDPQVIMAEPNYMAHAAFAETEAEEGGKGGRPDSSASSGPDLSFLQWYAGGGEGSVYSTPSAPLHAGYGLNVPGWNEGEENASGTICVMDTGIDTTHPDLANVLYTFTEEQQEKYGCGPHGINVNTRELDGIKPPVDEETYRKDISDHFMHGTHIAGIIGAEWNREGISGIANGIRILAVRLFEDDGMGQGASDVLKGFEWLCGVAQEVNLKAVNVSLGSMKPQLIHTAMANKLGELGVNTVYASGNSASNLDETIDMGGQNNSPYVIVVNAADMDGKMTQFSCYGQMSTDIFAPGVQMLSTIPEIMEKRMTEGTLMNREVRRRFFPEAMEKAKAQNGSIERFDGENVSVRFFDRCPVSKDGGSDPDAKEIGGVSSEAGFDDDFCWAVPYSMLGLENKDAVTWMKESYTADSTLWIAIPIGKEKAPKHAAVKASLDDNSHIIAGLTGMLCGRKETDGTVSPAVIDMRYDNVLSRRELEGQAPVSGTSVTMTTSISAAQWSELCVDLDLFAGEAAYYHSIASEENDSEETDEIVHPTDPGEIDGFYEWEDGGQKYVLLEYGVAKVDAPEGRVKSGSTALYFDNIAVSSDDSFTGAYESLCGTSMAAPCVTASLAVIAKDEPATADMTEEERSSAAIERKAKLLAAVDYDEDLTRLCSTGGRLNLHGQSGFTRKAPVITHAETDGQILTVRGYFFGGSGSLYIDGKPVSAGEWSDNEITADTGLLPNGMHEVHIVNEDKAEFRRLFSSSALDEGRRLYEKSWPLPLDDELFQQDQADGLFGMGAMDGSLYVMAVYGLEQAKSMWRLDLDSGKWSRCADLPDTVSGRTVENCGLIPWQGRLYCYTDRSGLFHESPSLWAYDPASDTWEEFIHGKLPGSSQLFALEDGLFLLTEESRCFYRVDTDSDSLVPVSGTLPFVDAVYSCQVASSARALYLLGSVYQEEGDMRVLWRMVWDSGKETFVQEDLSGALSEIGTFSMQNVTMRGYEGGAVLVTSSESGQDTFLLEDGAPVFRVLDQVSCYHTAFQPISAYADGWLYVFALNATEPEVAYLRSTELTARENTDSSADS